jgi:hypothetical protein
VNYLTAFSSDFPRNYTVLGSVPWTVVSKGKSGPGGIWTEDGSSVVIANAIDTKDDPQSGQKAGLQPVGPGKLFLAEDFN